MKILEQALFTLKQEIENLQSRSDPKKSADATHEFSLTLRLIELLNQLIPLIKLMNFWDVLNLVKAIAAPIESKRNQSQSFLMQASMDSDPLIRENLLSFLKTLNEPLNKHLPTKNTHLYLVLNKDSLIALDFEDGRISGFARLKIDSNPKLLKTLHTNYPNDGTLLFPLTAEHVKEIEKKMEYQENQRINTKQILPQVFPDIILNIQKEINKLTKDFEVGIFLGMIETLSQLRVDTVPDKIIPRLLDILKISVDDEKTLQLAQSIRKFATTLSTHAKEIVDPLPGSTALFYGAAAILGIQTWAKDLIETLGKNIENYSKLKNENSSSANKSLASTARFFQDEGALTEDTSVDKKKHPYLKKSSQP